MALLKTYSISEDVTQGVVNSILLKEEIKVSQSVDGFTGITTKDDVLNIFGDGFSNEGDCDNVVLNHDIYSLSTPTRVELNWERVGMDYFAAREQCVLLCQDYDPYVSNFPFASDEDNYVAIEFMAVLDANKDRDSTAMVTWLMGKGYSQEDAQGYVIDAAEKSHNKSVDCMESRWKKGKRVAMVFLDVDDQTNFAKSTSGLVDNMLRYAIHGRNYRDKDDGIMDFIESTNEWIGQGLAEKNYDITGVPFTDPSYPTLLSTFIGAMKEALVNNNLVV